MYMHIPRDDTSSEKAWEILESLGGLIGEGLLLHEATLKSLEEVVISSNAQVTIKKKITSHMKIQWNMAESKKQNKTSENNPKETQIYELYGKEF